MGDIDLKRFGGMNNVNESFYADNKGTVSPKVVLNANVGPDGELDIRAGITAFLALPGSHSLWSDGSICMLCAAAGKLYNVSTGVAVEIATIDGPIDEVDGALDYCLCEDNIHVSNLYWRGVFDPSTNTVSDWGIDLPPGPMLLSANGNLPAGTYNVCFTTVSGSEISGNGTISSIELLSEGGISILNRPSSSIVWATDKNEAVFCLVGAVDTITSIPTSEPMPSFLCAPPRNMTCIGYAFGRVWGAQGQYLYCSEPYRPSLFSLTNKVKFNSDINLLAFVSTGIFVGMDDQTRFLMGTEPEKMEQSNAGAGSVKGTLKYCNNVPYLADKLGLPEKTFVDVPIWRTHDGIVAGNASGRLFNLTKDKLATSQISRGASLYHNIDGVFRFLTSSLSGDGNVDADTLAALTSGRLPVNDIINKIPTSNASMSEVVSCEVYRDGVLLEE